MSKINITPAQGPAKLQDWIDTRGGIAVWGCLDLGNCGKQWFTPATIRIADCGIAEGQPLPEAVCPKCRSNLGQLTAAGCTCACGETVDGDNALAHYPRPHWSATTTPKFIITDPTEVTVDVPKEVKRFRVGLRRGAQRFKVKCTDASSRRIRAAVEVAGDGAWYEFDYDTQEAVIYVAERSVPLNEYLQAAVPA